jgi:hypothetical protein
MPSKSLHEFTTLDELRAHAEAQRRQIAKLERILTSRREELVGIVGPDANGHTLPDQLTFAADALNGSDLAEALRDRAALIQPVLNGIAADRMRHYSQETSA